jgi:AraC-like DNA-binding protein
LKSEIKKYKFKIGLPIEFEIITISDLYSQHKNILSTPHRADFYHIIWIQKGSAIHFVDFKPFEINANSILFVPKDCVIFFDLLGNYDGKIILFTSDFFSFELKDNQFLQTTILYNDLFEISQIQLDDNDTELNSIFYAMETELSKPNDQSTHSILRNFLYNLLLISERKRRKQGFREIKPSIDLDYLILFKDLLEKNFKTIKSVSNYAYDLSVSEKRLNKVTTKILGKTPKQIIDERVLLEAKRLLAHSNNSIKEIAFGLGFEEPTNFNKYFRKHTNKTPSAFRENYK